MLTQSDWDKIAKTRAEMLCLIRGWYLNDEVKIFRINDSELHIFYGTRLSVSPEYGCDPISRWNVESRKRGWSYHFALVRGGVILADRIPVRPFCEAMRADLERREMEGL